VLDSTNEMRPYAFVYLAGYNEHGLEHFFFFMIELVTVCNVKSGTKYCLFFCYKINTRSKYNPPLTKLRVLLIRSTTVHEIRPIKYGRMTFRFVEKGLQYKEWSQVQLHTTVIL